MLAGAWVLSGRIGVAEAPVEWAKETMSPRPASAASVSDRFSLASCPEGDAALGVVAASLAEHKMAASDVDAVTHALRAAGEPHVWPRAMTVEGQALDPREAALRIGVWLGHFHHRGRLRCAVSSSEAAGKRTVAAVAVDAQADLEPIAVVARPSSWIEVGARVLVPATQAKVVVLGPSGAPHTVPTSFVDGRVHAFANVDRAGAWLFQVVVDGASGPRPVLEALVFAGVALPRSRSIERAPGEEVPASADTSWTVNEMVATARASEGLEALGPSRALDRVARAHTERMMRAGELGHDAGDGDVRERVREAGIDVTEIGENVAHAANLALAHRALWSSPSHRANMLGTRFGRLGVGVVADADGTVWLTEVFATPR
jgi:uncharacterized protein YkwD